MKKAAYILVWGLLFVPPVARATSGQDAAHRQAAMQKLAKKNAKKVKKQRDKQAKAMKKWKKAHGVAS
jgi:membrane protein insertase Oxa1/YidC/SpoIIIJ